MWIRDSARAPSTSRAPRARSSSSAPRRCTSKTRDRKSTRLNSSHLVISYAVFCLKKHKEQARVIELLVERVDYDGKNGTVSITFHQAGIRTLAQEQGHEVAA